MVLLCQIVNYPDIFQVQCMPSGCNAVLRYCEVSMKLNEFCKDRIFMIPWNSHDSWKGHINYMIPKLSSPCYVMRTVKFYVSHNTLKIIYYSYSHSIMNYGILFWGPSTASIKIFKLQKRIIRITMGCKRNQSCRELFVKLGLLPLHSQYILSLLMFLFKNKHQFPVNTKIHHHATRQQSNFHQPWPT